MTRIPAAVVVLLRGALYTELSRACEDAPGGMPEAHTPSGWTDVLARIDSARNALDALGWDTPARQQDVEVELDRAMIDALEADMDLFEWLAEQNKTESPEGRASCRQGHGHQALPRRRYASRGRSRGEGRGCVMARPATGQVIVDERRRSPSYGLRFRAYGRREYVALGTAADGWTRAKAQTELQNILADVRRGIWRPPAPEPAPEIDQDPSFHEFASQWFESTKEEWREKTQLDYGWQLSSHLLPFFKSHRLSQITIAEVDRYRQAKVAEARAIQAAAANGRPLTHTYTDKNGCERKRSRRALSATSINKTITRLGQVLEVAVEYGLIGANPAKGRRRRLKPQKAAPVWLDRAEHIEALLDAAGALDNHAKAKGGHDQKGGLVYRRALLSTLVFAGLRIGELTALQWRDVDLAGSRLTVRASKTDAGMRQVDLLPALRDELAAYKTQAPSTAPSGFVFTTAAGSELIQGNIRRRALDKAVATANEKLIEAGEVPLPEGLTPHKLRHTFASILVALGVDPGSVMDQLGHTDPGFTLRVYRHGMRRDGTARERLQALVGGAGWAAMGNSETRAPWTELAASNKGNLKGA